MGYEPSHYDDVIYATEGRKDINNVTKTKVSVPAVATRYGKTRRATLDVGPKGKQTLDKMIDEAQRKTRDAWKPVTDVLDKSVGEEKPPADKKAPTSTDKDGVPQSDSGSARPAPGDGQHATG